MGIGYYSVCPTGFGQYSIGIKRLKQITVCQGDITEKNRVLEFIFKIGNGYVNYPTLKQKGKDNKQQRKKYLDMVIVMVK